MPESGSWDRRTVLLVAGTWLLSACTGRRSAASRPAAATIPDPVDDIAGLIYTVERGDTLSAIGRRSGLSVQRLIASNRLDSSAITVGQRLRLPGITTLRADPLSGVVSARERRSDPSPILPGRYRLTRRQTWTKAQPGSNHRPMGLVHRITVHHTGEHGRMSHMSDLETVQSIERHHRNNRGWAAIGYHFLIGSDGVVYEGRPATMQGAHTRGNNRNNLGISLIGDFDARQPSQQQLLSLESLLEEQRGRHRVPKRRIFGHRDLSPSTCPGRYLYAWLQDYKRR